jgi:ferric-dicitrate binding protein FerR (iron transport regulator)
VFDQGYDCGTAFAQHESTNGQSEATPMGNAENNIDCAPRIRDRRSLAGGFAVAAALMCAAAVLGAGNIGTSRPRNEREALRLNS